MAIGGRGTTSVKVSAASARLKFNGCEPNYIRDVCKAACCRSSVDPSGIIVTIHPSERLQVIAHGAKVKKGHLVSVNKQCPFQEENHLCGLHNTPDKPFGCIASPFTLNKNGTLIIRNRYKLLVCYNDGPKLPAYVAFRASLDLMFGKKEAARIVRHLNSGGGDIIAYMPTDAYMKLMENDAAKRDRHA
ncbi:hypothetical protein LCGC14_0528960 [marine sediment metagenome]|uniref:Uncharacterized protein n=1 Tax=marine sediment metagenome TaxID=412755 RepID=A0A0F9SEF7_9ZZZZ